MKKMEIKHKLKYLFVFLVILANLFVWGRVLSLHNSLEVTFFDIGEGDSIFIETPQGNQFLIDGGPSGRKVLEKLGKEMPFWDKTLDGVFLTHPDYDHILGLNWVLEAYEVENIFWNGAVKKDKTFEWWVENLKEELKDNSKHFILRKGDRVSSGKVSFNILAPFKNLKNREFIDNANDSSLVFKLKFKNNSFLFTGDITGERELQIAKKSDVKADVLKISHHGSNSSSYERFLKEVAPQLAVISCGENNLYHHPSDVVLKRLGKFGIKVVRTDKKGNIKIFSDGRNFNF